MTAATLDKQAKDKLIDFLRVYSKKFYIKVKFKVFFQRCKLLMREGLYVL